MLPTTIEEYLGMDVRQLGEKLRGCSTEKWHKKGQETALQLFHAAARRVSAYAHFLQRSGVNAEQIASFADFQMYVPPTDKENYVDQYPLEDLVWDGDISRSTLINSSAGPHLSPAPCRRSFPRPGRAGASRRS